MRGRLKAARNICRAHPVVAWNRERELLVASLAGFPEVAQRIQFCAVDARTLDYPLADAGANQKALCALCVACRKDVRDDAVISRYGDAPVHGNRKGGTRDNAVRNAYVTE
jgi:hypothetical protein